MSTPSSNPSCSFSQPDRDTASICSSRTVSILDRWKCPRPSHLARKRKIAANSPPTGKRTCRGHGGTASNPKNINPAQRVKENPNEALTVSGGRLFCSACREELALKKSSIESHVMSAKHQSKKKLCASTEAQESDLAQSLVKYNQEVHTKGETLPIDMQVYRVRVVTTFLRAAVPLSKLELFHDILEESAFRLSDRRQMSDLVPFVCKEEYAAIKREIAGKHVAVIFDGTTHFGEALAIVMFVTDDFEIKQRLIRLQLLEKSRSGEEIARELITVLSVNYGIHPSLLLAAMRDGASSNNVAMRTLNVVYPHIFDVAYFSHTLDRVGRWFSTPNLIEYINTWISLFSHSPKVKLLWKEKTGKVMGSYSATRWWSKWEIMHQVLQFFRDIQPFLAENAHMSPATRAKLLNYFSDSNKNKLLQVEQAAIIDWGEPFVKATYKLEGDGPLALHCYEVIETIKAYIHASHTPNILAVAEMLSGGVAHDKHLMIDHAKQCIQPGIDYFNHQLTTTLQRFLTVFKAARLFSPQKMQDMQPSASSIDSLSTFPFFDEEDLGRLKSELPVYLGKAVDLDASIDPVQW